MRFSVYRRASFAMFGIMIATSTLSIATGTPATANCLTPPCSSQGNNQEEATDKLTGKEQFWVDLAILYGIGLEKSSDDDPYLDAARIRDSGAGVTSATGGPLGSSANSRTTTVNTGLTYAHPVSY